MKGLQLQRELENPAGILGGFFLKKKKNGSGTLKTKEKGKPTVKSHINFNMR